MTAGPRRALRGRIERRRHQAWYSSQSNCVPLSEMMYFGFAPACLIARPRKAHACCWRPLKNFSWEKLFPSPKILRMFLMRHYSRRETAGSIGNCRPRILKILSAESHLGRAPLPFMEKIASKYLAPDLWRNHLKFPPVPCLPVFPMSWRSLPEKTRSRY